MVPIVDLHCDLLSYLADQPGADADDVEMIGCAVPRLVEGGVALQVVAIYSGALTADPDSVARQVAWIGRLTRGPAARLSLLPGTGRLEEALGGGRVCVLPAIEGATALCQEGEGLHTAFAAYDRLTAAVGRILYVSLTHHGENRFGGGNATTVGLKADGRALLDHLSGREIAIDLSHTSDALAYGILDHIDRSGLDLPIIASHSNFRRVWDHPRNLPDDVARQIIRRGGLIGINLLREFLDRDDPEALTAHLEHGLELGGERAMCFGADYFATARHPDRSRVPFYHHAHEHAGCYPSILANLGRSFDPPTLEGLAWRNAVDFLERTWAS